ncbi:MoxR family ATPase [Anabaena sp. UHCC 0451]|uniref:AAA family ATPase n=1 Tax=Anabaena sp. UHCC 0451 TaxID=2055235 RepID=UPI002B21E574|nr:MoxR family ATPase [Anabaena sp. UHCC 0451]MEA5577619.1 MoxR family ATPase [Anabaena sp. UHCC 0451]
MTNTTFDYNYTGLEQYQPQPDRSKKEYPYYPDENLIKAVNLSIALDRPLLLQGEPGCGKTLLAKAIAYEFQQRLNIPKYPYFSWSIKSTTRAKEGLYTYDTLARLRDAQLVGRTVLSDDELSKIATRVNDPQHQAYIKYGALGYAFQETEYRPIVLIDEIDKADIDFPNDLLEVLEESKFEITEIGKTKPAKQQPIIIITSNDEKELPDAFLRRCIYYYIEFPEDKLIQIVNGHLGKPLDDKDEVVKQAVEKFMEVRNQGTRRKDGKKPSTSELLDFILWLKRSSQEEALDFIKNLEKHPHLLGVLLKSKEDQDYYKQQAGVNNDE